MSLFVSNETRARCSLTEQFSYELTWVPEANYVAATQIELRSHCLRAFHSWRHVRIDMEGADVTFRWKVAPTASDLRINRNRVVLRATLRYGVRKGQPLRIRLTAIPPIWDGIDEILSVWIIDAGKGFAPPDQQPEIEPVREEGSECTLSVESGPVERLEVYARPAADGEGRVRVCLVPEDRYGNPSAFEQPVSLMLGWQEKTWQETLQEPRIILLDAADTIARLKVLLPMADLALVENVSNGVRADDAFVVESNPVWPGDVAGLLPAFGEFHWHTEISGDGQRSIEEALRCARDLLNMDYAAPGDHNTRGDDWDWTVRALDDANEPGLFATFYGWENASDRGHENYYFTDPNHPLVCGGSAGVVADRPDVARPTLLKQEGFFSVPHHTNAVAETRRVEDDAPVWHPYPWAEPAPYLRLVEIMQCRGNQERNVYSDAWRGWHQNNGASVQDALARGYKLGFTGGTDNHCGWPGRAYALSERPFVHQPKSVIMTGVWTPRIERQAVYDALDQRHTWAVWDTRAIVYWTLNGALMGDDLEVAPNTPLVATIKLSAEDALQSLEIVSRGEAVWARSFTEKDIDIEVPLGAATGTTYFYLRGLLRNGGILYASPVFVSLMEE